MTEELRIVVEARNLATAQLNKLEGDLGRLQGQAGKTGSAFGTMARAAAGFTAVIGGGMLAGLGAAVKTAADFEQSLANLGAATGATKDQIGLLRTEALGIGKDTSKSASEAAEAMSELLKAGMPIEAVLNGAARSATQMAEATGIDIPQAAVLVSNALNTFKKDGIDAAAAANIFARAANASAIDVSDMGQSLSAVGPVAAQAGLSMEDFAAAIGLLGNNALKGSDAGTSLKTMISMLAAPTDKAKNLMGEFGVDIFDATGKMRPFRDILGNLQRSFAGVSDETRSAAFATLFGADAVRAANILVGEGVEGWDAFKASMAGAPTIAEQSAARLNTLSGRMEMLKGTIETIAITVGTMFLPILTLLADKLASGLSFLLEADWSGVQRGVALVAASFAALLAAVQTGDFTPLITNLKATLSQMQPAIESAATNAGTFLESDTSRRVAAVGAIWAGLPALILAPFALLNTEVRNKFGDILDAGREKLGELADFIGSHFEGAVRDFGHTLEGMVTALKEDVIPALLVAIGDAVVDISTGLASWGAAFIDWIAPRIVPMLETLGGLLGEMVIWLGTTALPEIAGGLRDWGQAFIDWVGPQIPPLLVALGGLLVDIGTWIVETAAPELVSKLGAWGLAFLGFIVKDVLPFIGEKLADLATAIGVWVVNVGAPAVVQHLKAVGLAILDGIKAGITAGWGAFVGFMEDLISKLPGPVRKALRIDSPSKVFAEQVGVPIVQGIAAGILAAAPAASAALTVMGDMLLNQARQIGEAAATLARSAGWNDQPVGEEIAFEEIANYRGLGSATRVKLRPGVSQLNLHDLGISIQGESDAELAAALHVPLENLAKYLEERAKAPKPPSLDGGGLVLGTGIALVHKGEQVSKAGQGMTLNFDFSGTLFAGGQEQMKHLARMVAGEVEQIMGQSLEIKFGGRIAG